MLCIVDKTILPYFVLQYHPNLGMHFLSKYIENIMIEECFKSVIPGLSLQLR